MSLFHRTIRFGRHRRAQRVLSVVVGPLLALGMITSASGPAGATVPWIGLLAPTSSQLGQLAGGSVTHVAIGVGWNNVEPQPGYFDPSVLASLRSAISAARSKGLQVVLDPGLQYPPSWVFSVGGQTRFVNQYGDVWHGVQSEDVPNAVFNTAVRSAEAAYIAKLGATVSAGSVVSVRVGGLLSGELRYPSNNYNGHVMSLWMYDSAAQAKAPYPGWKPGAGTDTAASASLSYYFNALTGYQTWLMKTVGSAFPGVDQEVLYPSWGLRPNMVSAAISAGLHNTTVAEVNGLISQGLDWTNQVKAAATAGVKATVYCTWVDAPSQGTSVQQIPPVDYLASLAVSNGLPIAGENTGRGGQPALDLTLQRAKADNLSGVMYMSGTLIANGTAGVTISQLQSSARLALA